MSEGINATARRFGHPDTLVAEYAHWLVLLREEQPTLDSLVLVAKGGATAFGALDPAAYAELAAVTRDIEATLTFEKINYLMLMMVDPHVHFHVIPRYPGERAADGVAIIDHGWPKAPALGQAVMLTATQRDAFVARLREAWPA